jgi:class 3 adenylate cyclase
LETIGDTYIATTGLFNTIPDKDIRGAAANAIKMAKDMVREVRQIQIPEKSGLQSLEICVGIHVGEITAGVLGERLPKYTVFGTTVNMSA